MDPHHAEPVIGPDPSVPCGLLVKTIQFRDHGPRYQEWPMTTKITVRIASIAAGCLAAASAVQAAPLTIVDVGAPAINCVFSPTKIPNAPQPACSVGVNH